MAGMNELQTVDLRGLKCPTPIVRLNEAFRALDAGSELIAIASDRAFELDVKAWCRRTGHELLALEHEDETLTARLRKRAG
jgi:TusA-related sulfurtransferase